MFRRRRLAPAHEDPAVVDIERVLAAAAPAGAGADLLSGRRPNVARALWICGCVTMDDAPTWLIYETVAGELGWCRVPDGTEPLDLVDARLTAGGHADPAEVLRWLRGVVSDPWAGGGDGSADEGVLDDLRAKVRNEN